MEQTHDILTDGTAAPGGRSEAGKTGASNGDAGATAGETGARAGEAGRSPGETGAGDGHTGTRRGETGAQGGETGARVVELAGKVRLAQRTAAEFMRRWAVEQAVEEVGLVALRDGSIDLPCSSGWLDALAGTES